MPEATVILQVRNDPERAQALIRNLQISGDFEIVVVDDSERLSLPLNWVREGKDKYIFSPSVTTVDGYYPDTKYVNVRGESLRLGYLMGREIGYRAAKCDPIIICDNDVVLPPNWWQEFKEILKDPKVGVIGPRFSGPKVTHDLQHVDRTWIAPEVKVVDIQAFKYMPNFELRNPAPPGTLNWDEFLTDIMLCWRRECLDQVRKMQLIYKDTTWLANAEYLGSSGLFHYPLGVYTAIKNGWKAVIANRVTVYHG